MVPNGRVPLHQSLKSICSYAVVLFLTLRFLCFPSPILALETTLTAGSDWDSGVKVDLDTTVNEGDMQLAADGSLGARNWRTPDLPLNIGSSFASDGTDIYVTRGIGDVLFWKYSPTTDEWTTLADMPRGVYYGAELEVLNGYVYVLSGGFQNTFARYSIATNTWELLPNVPDLVYAGASLANDGTDLYVLRGYNSQDFYRFNVASQTWTPLSGTPAYIAGGADLVRVGNYLYTPRGVSTTTFYRYDLTLGTWTTLAALPATVSEDVDASTDGTYIYYTRQINTPTFYAYHIATNTWSTLTNLPGNARYAGAIYHSADGYVYIFQGNGSYNFWKYNPTTATFVGPADMPAGISTGSDMVYYNGNLYTPRGSGTTTMYGYEIASGTWTTLTAAPNTIGDDTKGVAAGAYIYFFRGSGFATLYRFDPATNTWATMTDAPAIVRYGGTLAYPGSGDYIYATQGATTGKTWRYSISGNSWDDAAMAELPVDAEASYGARLISDGTNIYYMAGLGMKRFFRYTIATNTWSELAVLPFSPFYGSDIAYYSGKFVAIAGWYKNDVWEYTIATNTWRKLRSLPGYLAQNIGPYGGAAIEYDGAGTMYVSKANGTPYVVSYAVSANNYESSGTWTSAIQDLTAVTSWSSLSANTTTPADSAISFETRTSTDSATWSGWQAVNSGVIASPAQRYLQIKATLIASSGNVDTPTLHAVTVAFTGDVTAPSNPSTVIGLSQEVGGEALLSGGSYAHIHPYFSWTGATDAGTSVAGYYVYFGTNELADPSVVGEYQTTSNYTVTTPVATGTYYLRISTKDAAGNISNGTTLFTYHYAGISPAQSLSVTDSASFTGSATDTNTTNDVIKLASRANGFWQQETLAAAPATIQYGAKNMAYVEEAGKLYVFRGANTTTFYEYDIATDVWTTLANAPANVYIGGGVIEGPAGYLYGLPGNNTTTFWRYSIADNTWSDVDAADLPLTAYYGTNLVYDGSQFIYVVRGNSDDAFWRYNTSDDTWETLTSTNFGATSQAATNVIYIGGDITIDSANHKIYAIQGNLYDGFAVYDIDTNAWTVLPDVPALPYLDANIEYVSATNTIYFTPAYTSDKVFKYGIDDQTWTQVAEAPGTLYYGSTVRNVGDYLYLLQGNNSTSMFKYNLAKDSWTISNRGLFGEVFQGTSYVVANYGADLCKGDGDNYYITRGNYADDFVRWNESTGAITRLKNAPVGTYLGSSLVYDNVNGKIYLTGGIYMQKFYVYDIATNTWSEEASDPYPVNVDYGSAMVFDGSRYIYLSRGGNTTNFYRFDTQGSPGSKWSSMAVAPNTLGYGSELVLRGGYIYALRGQNVANNPLYRYEIATNTWSDAAVADMAIDVYNDGFMVDGGDGYLYAARAENDNDFYRYSLAGNSWSQLGNAPANIYVGGTGEANGTNKIFMMPGAATGAAADGIYTYVMQTENSGFEEAGSYTSQAHDLTSVYKWANLVVDYTSATNTTLSIQTRSSADASTWSSWTAVAAAKQSGSTYTYNIKSPAARYVQVAFSLTSADGVSSGTINGYTINYYKDVTAPTNPETAGFSAYSSNASGSALIANTWYGHATPYFDWPEAEATNGASDTSTGAGVAGYYVYFGTDATADPATAGTQQTATAYTAGSLVNGNTYYLRIKTLDNAGNVSADVWQPFIYKFDGEAAAAPTNVTSDPSGYSATDSFDFSWEAATGSGAAVTAYCYKTGASTGDYATDQCTTETSVTGLPSYRVGSNTFYVRTKDAADNYSSYATATFYYVNSDNAPAPPTNLTVTPSSNTTNSFAFSWSPPASGTYYGSVSNLSYYYSINALPTAQSTTATSLTSLIAGAYATLPGDNTFYIVTKDEAGNINYSNYASVTFTANTTAPGIPLNVDIADVSVKSTSSWKIALSWEAPSGGSVDHYAIARSTDGTTFSQIATSGGISYVDVGLSQVTYYYKVKACDSTNNCGVYSDIVSLRPDGKFTVAADLIADPVVSAITTRKATVSWSTGRTADSRISYGTSAGSYFDEEVSNSDQVTSHSLNLLNLSPGTTYYFVTKWTDEDGNLGVSDEYSFTTAPPPSTSEPSVKSIGLETALIEFTSKNAARVRIYYGESSAFGGIEDVVTGAGEGTHTVQLTDLKDGTKYYYKINSFDSEGEEYEGEIHSFSSLPRPKISGVKVSQVKGTARSTLLITWLTNTDVSSIVTYYPISAPSAAKDEVNIALKSGKHQMILYDLEPQTTYAVIIKGKDSAGNEAAGEIQQVSTSADTRPPQISELKVEGEILGTGEDASAQLVVSYTTDEPSTAQIEFGEGSGTTYSQKTQEDGGLTTHHLVVISELTPAKVYHLRALSKDQYNNLAQSVDKVVITPKATENALDLVVTNMSSIFGFLSRGN